MGNSCWATSSCVTSGVRALLSMCIIFVLTVEIWRPVYTYIFLLSLSLFCVFSMLTLMKAKSSVLCLYFCRFKNLQSHVWRLSCPLGSVWLSFRRIHWRRWPRLQYLPYLVVLVFFLLHNRRIRLTAPLVLFSANLQLIQFPILVRLSCSFTFFDEAFLVFLCCVFCLILKCSEKSAVFYFEFLACCKGSLHFINVVH